MRGDAAIYLLLLAGIGMGLAALALLTGDLLLPVSLISRLNIEDDNRFQQRLGYLLLTAGALIFLLPLMITFSDQPQWLIFLVLLTGLAVKMASTQAGKERL